VNANDTLTINTGNSPAAVFNINLGDQNDSLTFGLGNATNGVSNVTIDGGSGTDNVILNDLTAGGDLAITAESTRIAGNVATSGNQSYNNATSLSTPATLNAGTGTITFADTLDTGSNALTLTADGIDFKGGVNSVTGSG